MRVLSLVFLLAVVPLASATACMRDGSSYSYTESVSGDTRTIVTNFCPNHPFFNNNPNTAISTSTTLRIPAKPKFKGAGVTANPLAASGTYSKDLMAQGGNVGVFYSGVMLYSPFGASCRFPLSHPRVFSMHVF